MACAGYAYHRTHKLSVDVSSKNPTNTSDQTSNDATEKASSVSADENNGVDTSKNTSEIPISKEITISIDQLYQNGSDIIYSGVITNPGTNGTCSASFANSISKPVNQVNKVSGSICGPFTIAGTSFDSTGNWTLTLRYYSDNSQAVDTKTIEVK